MSGLLEIGAERVSRVPTNPLPTVPTEWEMFLWEIQWAVASPHFWLAFATVAAFVVTVSPALRRRVCAIWAAWRHRGFLTFPTPFASTAALGAMGCAANGWFWPEAISVLAIALVVHALEVWRYNRPER